MNRYLVIAMASAVVGCSADIEMYPVYGPLASERPLPVAHGIAEGVGGNSGKLSITLASGERCEGRWSSVAPRYSEVSAGSLIGRYGQLAGFSDLQTGIQPGVNRGEAVAVCASGNVIQAEFFTGSGTANGYGVATDSFENVYRLLF